MLNYSLKLRIVNGLVGVTSLRYNRGPFNKPKRSSEDRNRAVLDLHNNRRLKLAEPVGKPDQWKLPPQPADATILKKDRKLLSQVESVSPYQPYSEQDIKSMKNFGTYYDPLFNPHLEEERNRVDPESEPFNAIYVDSKSKAAQDYTQVRNITTPELWDYVERLARIKIAPEPIRRKAGEPIKPMPSGFVPPPETPPDLPYFIARTRNYLLPVYYKLHSDPENCYTTVKKVKGDLWQLEEDLRTHLEQVTSAKRRILTSVLETDDAIRIRGKYIHEVVSWLHLKGF